MNIICEQIADANNVSGFYVRGGARTIRRECLDHVVVLGERHLRQLLANYAAYYNGVRTHLALDKDSPLHRPAQTVGRIASVAWLGGLHRHYVRMA